MRIILTSLFFLILSTNSFSQCEELAADLVGSFKLYPNDLKMESEFVPQALYSCEFLSFVEESRHENQTVIVDYDKYIVEIFPKNHLSKDSLNFSN